MIAQPACSLDRDILVVYETNDFNPRLAGFNIIASAKLGIGANSEQP